MEATQSFIRVKTTVFWHSFLPWTKIQSRESNKISNSVPSLRWDLWELQQKS